MKSISVLKGVRIFFNYQKEQLPKEALFINIESMKQHKHRNKKILTREITDNLI